MSDANEHAGSTHEGRPRPRGRPFTTENQPDPAKKAAGGVAAGEARKVPKLLREMRAIVEAREKPARLTPYQEKLWTLYETKFERFMAWQVKLETAWADTGKEKPAPGDDGVIERDEGTERAMGLLGDMFVDINRKMKAEQERFLKDGRCACCGQRPVPGQGEAGRVLQFQQKEPGVVGNTTDEAIRQHFREWAERNDPERGGGRHGGDD
jgi:hypothetical protein